MHKEKIFAVIYQGYVKASREKEYCDAWKKVATYFMAERGSLGSALHQGENGLWIAYSRWPDKATRDASWKGLDHPSADLPVAIQDAIHILKDCMEVQMPEICMEIVEDLIRNNNPRDQGDL